MEGAAAREAAQAADNVGRLDLDAELGEELGKALVVDREGEVGNKDGVLDGQRGHSVTRDPQIALPSKPAILLTLLTSPVNSRRGFLCLGSLGSFASLGFFSAFSFSDDSPSAFLGARVAFLGLASASPSTAASSPSSGPRRRAVWSSAALLVPFSP